MAQYRKKPVVIEAVQWFPGRKIEGVCWCAKPNPPSVVVDTN